jgi:hypothetical protein
MSEIKGVTVYRHAFMHGTETHYFGYDEDGEDVVIDSNLDGILMGTHFSDDEIHEFHEFIDKLVNEIMIFTWDNYYSNDHVLDGEEWRVTIHYKSERTRSFSGMNEYPSNFDDFVKLCKAYDFAFEDDNNYDFDESNEITWYDDFLEEIDELEGILICPECDSDYVVHTNPMGYDFMCGNCGHNFEHKDGRHKKDFENEEKKHQN